MIEHVTHGLSRDNTLDGDRWMQSGVSAAPKGTLLSVAAPGKLRRNRSGEKCVQS